MGVNKWLCVHVSVCEKGCSAKFPVSPREGKRNVYACFVCLIWWLWHAVVLGFVVSGNVVRRAQWASGIVGKENL